MKDLLLSGLLFVSVVVFGVLLGLSFIEPSKAWTFDVMTSDGNVGYNVECIDGVSYLRTASRFTVKFTVDSTVELCE